MNELAHKFEVAVGQIVETVTSASTELEASAAALTSTAERSLNLAAAVASASEEASTNVQSVASAAKEMTLSVNEIGHINYVPRGATETESDSTNVLAGAHSLSDESNRLMVEVDRVLESVRAA